MEWGMCVCVCYEGFNGRRKDILQGDDDDNENYHHHRNKEGGLREDPMDNISISNDDGNNHFKENVEEYR